jgi:hypothetical protein
MIMNCIFFLGAGASVPFGVRTMTEMVTDFEAKTKEPGYALGYVIQEIKSRLRNYKSFDIEALLTVLQDIVNYSNVGEAIYHHPSLHFYSPIEYEAFTTSVQTLGKKYCNEAKQILNDVKNFIVESCNFKDTPFELYKELFSKGMKADFNYGQELQSGRKNIMNCIFTTNYDLVLEAYCNHLRLDYENGEIHGGLLDIDNTNKRLYEYAYNIHQIYKLHGSINWYVDEHDSLRWISEPVMTGKRTSLGHKVIKELLLYPVVSKYTYREPFYTMFHHLKECLLKVQVCYIVGYSFKDDDISGIYQDAMAKNNNLHLVLIDPVAKIIKDEKFSSYEDRVMCISDLFTIKAIEQLKDINV